MHKSSFFIVGNSKFFDLIYKILFQMWKMFMDSSASFYKKQRESSKKGSWNVSKFSHRKKEKQQQCGWKGYKILPEDEKERLVEYRKNITKCEKCKGFTRKDWFYGC